MDLTMVSNLMFKVFASIYNKTTLIGHIPNKAVYNLHIDI